MSEKTCNICLENPAVPGRNMCQPCVNGLYSPHEGAKPVWPDEMPALRMAREINQIFGVRVPERV